MRFFPNTCHNLHVPTSPSRSVLSVLCFMTRMEISPMNSMKRRWWQKMAERSPNWSGSRKILFHRWERPCHILRGWLMVRKKKTDSPMTVLLLSNFQGIVKLDHPCIHVDFPIILCEVWYFERDWSPLQCSHRCLSHSRVPVSKLQSHGTKTGDQRKNLCKTDTLIKCYTFVYSCSQGVPCGKKKKIQIHVLTFTFIVTVQVFTNQLKCKQTFGIQ